MAGLGHKHDSYSSEASEPSTLRKCIICGKEFKKTWSTSTGFCPEHSDRKGRTESEAGNLVRKGVSVYNWKKAPKESNPRKIKIKDV